MDDFSWTDGLRAALRPCLTCFGPGKEDDGGATSDANEGTTSTRNQRGRVRSSGRNNDLEGLLRTPDDSEIDAETLSLHSDVGRRRKRKQGDKRRKRKNGVTSSFFPSFFGRSQAIRLPESESEDDDRNFDEERRQILDANSSLRRSNSSGSSAAFDSDASSLDANSIANLSAQDALARAETAAREAEIRAEVERRLREQDEEQRRLEKAERKRSRMERRELRRASQLIAMGVEDGMSPSAFEHQLLPAEYSSPDLSNPTSFAHVNFAGYAPIPAEFTLQQPQPIAPLVRIAPTSTPLAGVIEEDEGDAHTDFGGEVYTLKARKSKSNLRNNSETGSSSSRSSRSHGTSSASSNDPSSIAYQRFLAMAALNGGQAALAALPSPSTPALSLSSPTSASGMASPGFNPNPGLDQQQQQLNRVMFANDAGALSLDDPPKRRKKRRPETWIAPSSSSPHSESFAPQPMALPPTFRAPDMPNGVVNSSLGLAVNLTGDFQGELSAKAKRKKNRMSMSAF